MIKVIQAGALSSVQDSGRFGWAHLGIPVSGFMDREAAHTANRMVGNELGEAVLEMTWTGIEFRSDVSCTVALAGAEFECQLNGHTVDTDAVIQLAKGSHFKMLRLARGVRAYMAFAGGIDVPIFAGSKSTLLSAKVGGFNGRTLRPNDQLYLTKPHQVQGFNKPHWSKLSNRSVHVVRAMPGPEFGAFSSDTIKQAFSQQYRLTEVANRQGFRLQSKAIVSISEFVMASSGLLPGSLQVTPDGQTILVMHDSQTTGGYPRILVVNQNQLSQLAQVRSGELVQFFVET